MAAPPFLCKNMFWKNTLNKLIYFPRPIIMYNVNVGSFAARKCRGFFTAVSYIDESIRRPGLSD